MLADHFGGSDTTAAAFLWCLGVLRSSYGLTNGTVAHQQLRSPLAVLPP